MKLTNTKKRRSSNNLLAELVAASAAGLIAALLTLLVKLLDQQYIPVATYIKYILLGVASYLAITLLLHLFPTRVLMRVAPNWLLTAFFGSILFVLLRLSSGIIGGWYDPHKLHLSFFDYISREIKAAGSVVIFLSFTTIPTSGLIFLLTYLVLRWREKRNSFS